MKSVFEKIVLLLKDNILLRRVLFTILALVVFRALANIPIPGVNENQLANLLSGQFGQFFGLVNIFSGGGLSNLSIVLLGVGPYITASIIMQLSTIIFPKLKQMYQEDGEVGRRKFMQYTRWITLPLAVIQGLSFLKILETQGVLENLTTLDRVLNVIIITAGAFLLVWIGELITEFGIGNGTSMIIFAGIVAGLPLQFSQFVQTYDVTKIPTYVALAAASLVVIIGVVYVTEAERPIPVTYAKRVRGNKVYGGVSTYLPIRLNQAGVIPIIFAISLLLFPQVILNLILGFSKNDTVQSAVTFVTKHLSPSSWVYTIAYFILVVAFTYFYTAVTFDPNQISDNLQKNGAFIPGVRPGQSTTTHLSNIIVRLTLVGALFLGLIAILPNIVQHTTSFTTFAIGGASILIVVSVVLDLLKKVGAQLTARQY